MEKIIRQRMGKEKRRMRKDRIPDREEKRNFLLLRISQRLIVFGLVSIVLMMMEFEFTNYTCGITNGPPSPPGCENVLALFFYHYFGYLFLIAAIILIAAGLMMRRYSGLDFALKVKLMAFQKRAKRSGNNKPESKVSSPRRNAESLPEWN